MPLIRIDLFEGRSHEQKKSLLEAITRETVRVLECSPDSVDIIFTDLRREDWATGGVFSPAELRDQLAGFEADGCTEIAYQPAGPDIGRELEAFANAVRG